MTQTLLCFRMDFDFVNQKEGGERAAFLSKLPDTRSGIYKYNIMLSSDCGVVIFLAVQTGHCCAHNQNTADFRAVLLLKPV